jgi:hypothetical protein
MAARQWVNGWLRLGLLLPLVLTLVVQPAAAQERPAALDLVLLIDDSGSMNLPQFGASDPAGLRYDAASLLIALINDDDRLGVVQFARTANNRLGELRRVGDDRRGLQELVAQLAAPQEQERQDPSATQYAPALTLAAELLQRPDATRRQAVILLTDGNPSDAGAAFAQLARLQQQGTAVFLLMLQPQYALIPDPLRRAETQRGIEAVLEDFRAAGHGVLAIDGPADIARAFATVITELQPGTYLDTLDGTAGSSASATTRFTLRAAAEQQLIGADLVFVANRSATSLAVQVERSAGSAALTAGTANPRYAVFSASARDGALSGEWRFTASARPDELTAFAFLRSEVRLRLRYPAPAAPRAGFADAPLLLAAEIDGLPAAAAAAVRLRVNPQRCPTTRAAQLDDLALPPTNSSGLSADGTPLFWTTLRAAGPALYVTVELAPADSVALWRCFPITLREAAAPELRISASAAELRDGRLPVRVEVPNPADWQPRLWLQAPDGAVAELAVAADGTALSAPLAAAGNYTLRAVAEGRIDGVAATLFAERTLAVAGVISSAQTDYDLGLIRSLAEPLTATINISAPLLARAADLQFPPELVALSDAAGVPVARDLLALDLCDGPRRLQDGVFSCDLALQSTAALPAGEYRLSVAVTAAQQDVRFERLVFRFVRPPSGVQLNLPTETLELPQALSDVQPRLEYPLRAEPVLREVLPQLQEAVELVEVRDERQQLIDAPLRVRLVAEDSGGAAYRLLVEAEGPLAAGAYRLKIRPRAAGDAAVFPPEATLLVQRRDANVILTPATAVAQDSISGVARYRLAPVFAVITLPWWPNGELAFDAEARDAAAFPAQLPPLQVVSVRRLDRSTVVDQELFAAAWRNAGAVAGRPLTEQLVLRLTAQQWFLLPAGEYELLLRSDAALFSAPRELLVIVPVRPWWQAWPQALAVLLLVVAGRTLYIHGTRGFSGDFELGGQRFALNGDRPHGLVFDSASRSIICAPLDNGTVGGEAPRITISCRNRREIEVRFADGQRRRLALDRPQSLAGLSLRYVSRASGRGRGESLRPGRE